MADEPKRGPEETDDTQSARRQVLTRIAASLRSHWVAGLLALSVMLNALAVWNTLLTEARLEVLATPEYELGVFSYASRDASHGGVHAARFQLHLHLLDGLDEMARERLTERRFRVEQGIEQLLRQAHGADFEDPTLAELKRQIQETVNQTIDVRAIADVIITDLDVERSATSSAEVPATAATAPWDADSAD